MKEDGFPNQNLIIGPSYPFKAEHIFTKLHKSLEEQRGRRIGFEELGTLLGKNKSSAHAFFRVYRHRPLLEFFSLLEQLEPHRRHSLVDSLCRHTPVAAEMFSVSDLDEIMAKSSGFSVLNGGSEIARTAVLSGLGYHWWALHPHRPPAGIDISRPRRIIGLPTLHYVDDTQAPPQIRQLVINLLLRIVTSRSPVLLMGNVWSQVPDIRPDLRRCARVKHIVVADVSPPSLAELQGLGSVLLLEVRGGDSLNNVRAVLRRA